MTEAVDARIADTDQSPPPSVEQQIAFINQDISEMCRVLERQSQQQDLLINGLQCVLETMAADNKILQVLSKFREYSEQREAHRHDALEHPHRFDGDTRPASRLRLIP